MQSVAINWHVYLLTKSALALGLVGLFRGLPIIFCSLAGGVIADAVDRKKLMVVTQTVMLASAALLTAGTITGLQSVWPIYVLSAFASAAQAFDIPARQAFMPTLVPVEDFPNAVSLGVIVFNVATIGGPAIAGFLLAESGPAVIYGINALSFLAVIAALVAMRTSGNPELQTERRDALSLEALKEGLRFVWRTPIIVQTMTLDFAATFFASATLLLPIFAQERLHVGARGYGFLAAAPAMGSVLTALVMARIGSFNKQGRLVVCVSGGVWRRHGGVRRFNRILVVVADACSHGRGRHCQHGLTANDSTARDAKSPSRSHDFDQRDVLHGWPTAWRVGGRCARGVHWRAAFGCHRWFWFTHLRGDCCREVEEFDEV